MCAFQFHLVRLKDLMDLYNNEYAAAFQFHLVRLKVQIHIIEIRAKTHFNSI